MRFQGFKTLETLQETLMKRFNQLILNNKTLETLVTPRMGARMKHPETPVTHILAHICIDAFHTFHELHQ